MLRLCLPHSGSAGAVSLAGRGLANPINMLRSKECVLNLASVDNVEAVNRLARTTGTNPVPEVKVRRGYRYVHEKF